MYQRFSMLNYSFIVIVVSYILSLGISAWMDVHGFNLNLVKIQYAFGVAGIIINSVQIYYLIYHLMKTRGVVRYKGFYDVRLFFFITVRLMIGNLLAYAMFYQASYLLGNNYGTAIPHDSYLALHGHFFYDSAMNFYTVGPGDIAPTTTLDRMVNALQVINAFTSTSYVFAKIILHG